MKTNARPMTKWLLSLVFALVVISLILIPQVLRVESSAAQYARGDLTESNTSTTGTINHISTAKQLAQLMYRVWKDGATFSGYTYVLDNDIDMRGANALTGFSLSNATSALGQITDSGSFTRPNADYGRFDKSDGTVRTFSGVLDGQGHTISGLCFFKNSGGGAKWQGLLFDRLAGTVKNVRIIDSVGEWDQPKSDSDSALGLIGGVTSGGLVENVVVESSVYLISKRNTSGNYLQTIGGIAGWVDGGTIRNCASFASVVSCTAQGALTYPLANARIQIGGVVGAIESTSTVQNCIGYGTYYSNVTERGFLAVTESYSNPGWNFACPAYLGNMGDKTISNVKGGKQTTAPGSGWEYYPPYSTYLPRGAGWDGSAGTYMFYIDQSISSYNTANRGSSYLITSADDLKTMVTKVNGDGEYGNNMVFKLTADLTFNSNSDMYLHSTWASGDPITLPTYPSGGNFGRFTDFKGVLDGQGHKITGMYAKRLCTNVAFDGGMFYKLTGTVKNLAIVNSFFAGDHTKNGSNQTYTNSEGVNWGGLAGYAYEGTVIENCYFDYDCLMINNYGNQNNNGNTNHGAYGYLFAQMMGPVIINDVTCAGRFVACTTNLTNTLPSGTCPCGVIAGYGNGYECAVSNFVVSGYRRTAEAGSAGTNYINKLAHWSNDGGNSITGIYYNPGTAPTANGSTYAYCPRFGEVLIKSSADYFNGVTTSYTLPLWAQVGSTSSNVRLLTHVSKAFAKTADEIGFRLTRSDSSKKATVKLYSVYKNIRADGNTYTATQLTGRGDYAYGLIITNFPAGITLTVEPYIKIGSTYYYGTSATYSR